MKVYGIDALGRLRLVERPQATACSCVEYEYDDENRLVRATHTELGGTVKSR